MVRVVEASEAEAVHTLILCENNAYDKEEINLISN